MDQGKIGIPDVHVGMIEVQALHFAGHVGRADDCQGPALKRKVVGVHSEFGAGVKISFIANPEGGMIDSAHRRTLEQARLDEVQAFFGWGGKKRRGGGWQVYAGRASLRRVTGGMGRSIASEPGGWCSSGVGDRLDPGGPPLRCTAPRW